MEWQRGLWRVGWALWAIAAVPTVFIAYELSREQDYQWYAITLEDLPSASVPRESTSDWEDVKPVDVPGIGKAYVPSYLTQEETETAISSLKARVARRSTPPPPNDPRILSERPIRERQIIRERPIRERATTEVPQAAPQQGPGPIGDDPKAIDADELFGPPKQQGPGPIGVEKDYSLLVQQKTNLPKMVLYSALGLCLGFAVIQGGFKMILWVVAGFHGN